MMKWFRRIALFAVTVCLLSAAAVPFVFECSLASGFLMDPNIQSRIGYITELTTPGFTLNKDLRVSVPFVPKYLQLLSKPGANGAPGTATVAGVIQKFSWNGGPSDPITIQFCVSQQNANTLKAANTKNNLVQSLGWWIGDFDPMTKVWFDEAYPGGSATVKAALSATAPVSVDLTPVPVKAGIDVSVYSVSATFAPQAHTTSTLAFATSSSKSATKTWGTP